MRISDGDEVWVQLTADELYADFCNSGHGRDVLARALRVGLLRGRQNQEEDLAVLERIEEKVTLLGQHTLK